LKTGIGSAREKWRKEGKKKHKGCTESTQKNGGGKKEPEEVNPRGATRMGKGSPQSVGRKTAKRESIYKQGQKKARHSRGSEAKKQKRG